MPKAMIHFCRDERGTTAIEYAIVAGGIAVAIIAAVKGLGISVLGNFEAVKAALN